MVSKLPQLVIGGDTDRQTEIERDGDTETQRETHTQKQRRRDRQTDRDRDKHTERSTDRDRDRQRQRHRERHRETERDRERLTDRQTNRQTGRQTETDRQRHRETERRGVGVGGGEEPGFKLVQFTRAERRTTRATVTVVLSESPLNGGCACFHPRTEIADWLCEERPARKRREEGQRNSPFSLTMKAEAPMNA